MTAFYSAVFQTYVLSVKSCERLDCGWMIAWPAGVRTGDTWEIAKCISKSQRDFGLRADTFHTHNREAHTPDTPSNRGNHLARFN